MKAADIKFGIEIECAIPSENWGARPIGSYHRGIQVMDAPACLANWKVESDSSICPPEGHIGLEIISPILKGREGLQNVIDVLEWLNSLDAKVNRSTGLHVTCTFPVADVKAMRRLINFTARHEDGMFAATGSRWRAEQCHYTGKIKDRFLPIKDLKSRTQFDRFHYTCPRYACLNLQHAFCGRDRIEFRTFAGTLNPIKMRGYIQLCLGIVERATEPTRTAKYERTTPHWIANIKCKGKGEGHTALWQLFAELNWVHTHDKAPMGLLETKQGTKDVRKKLLSLADKFDATPAR